ncbi:hypothetical protein [Pseudonocardia sp. GCM10023141]|uniref:hypothetical protein n=1 Tax=Pseudonocardia sp. GCM10023141 TaxID=3252653 RepID=UPI003612E1AE
MASAEFSLDIQMSQMHQIMTRTYAEPAQAAAITSATPQRMHHDLLASCPARKIDDPTPCRPAPTSPM